MCFNPDNAGKGILTTNDGEVINGQFWQFQSRRCGIYIFLLPMSAPASAGIPTSFNPNYVEKGIYTVWLWRPLLL